MIVLHVLLLAIFILCSSKAEAQEKKQIRVVFTSQTWTSSLPFRVALAKGYFRAQGLAVEPVFIRGGPAAIAALISGDADFGSIGGAQAVIPYTSPRIGYLDHWLDIKSRQLCNHWKQREQNRRGSKRKNYRCHWRWGFF